MLKLKDFYIDQPITEEYLLAPDLLDRTVEEFRRAVPLTTFEDYADVLLQKRSEMLPAEPVVWIQTTWEGGKHPIKLAPYTR